MFRGMNGLSSEVELILYAIILNIILTLCNTILFIFWR